jgi:hypothetical protein
VFLDYYEEPKFHLDITEKKKHWEFTPKNPVWVIQGSLKTTTKDPFKDTPTTYKWGFRAVVGFSRTKGYFVKEFPTSDKSGSYSSFIRAVMWEKLRRLL